MEIVEHHIMEVSQQKIMESFLRKKSMVEILSEFERSNSIHDS